MLQTIRKFFGVKTEAQKRSEAARIFADTLLLPDMQLRGFGFGRANTAKFLVANGITTFGELDSMWEIDTQTTLEQLAVWPGIGPKVVEGFARYMFARTGVAGVAGAERGDAAVKD